MTSLPESLVKVRDEFIRKQWPKKGPCLVPIGPPTKDSMYLTCHENDFCLCDMRSVWDAAIAHLAKECEFDYGAMDAELYKYFGRPANSTELRVAKHIALWQFNQMRARVGLADTKLACVLVHHGKMEYEHDLAMKRISELEAKLAEAYAEIEERDIEGDDE